MKNRLFSFVFFTDTQKVAKSSPPKRAIASSKSGANNKIPAGTTKKPKSVGGTSPADAYECPKIETFKLFPTLCTTHGQCIKNAGNDFRCCKQFGSKRCVQAMARPVPEPKHERNYNNVNNMFFCFVNHIFF